MKCEDCKWWKPFGNPRQQQIVEGQCRNKVPVVLTDGYETGSRGHTTVWPETKPTDFCGEFAEKEK